MNIRRWIARREADWKRLDVLLKQVEKRGLKSLRADEIRALASLHRSVSADLARIKSNQASQTLTHDLQVLTSRSYNQIYQGSRRQEWHLVVEFYRWGLPVVVQQTAGYTALATTLFGLGVLISWWFSWRDPSFMSLVVPEDLISLVRDKGELWTGSIIGTEPLASSSIMVNNLLVSFRAIAGGITAGTFTAFILVFNGLLIGAIATLVGQNNLAYPFWAFVLPHGSLELPAIFFSGAAGFLLARAILFPGKYSRSDALRYYGSLAVQLVYGIVPLLVIAGMIEGFFSPNPAIPDPVKYITGAGLFVVLVTYCSRTRSGA
jgi:uncharacterized membrane protein SpoIIM required for sporulation